MNCKTIPKKGELIIRFTKGGGKINKSVVCRINDIVSRHYIKPEVFERPESIDLVVTSKDNVKLSSIRCFVKKILFPHAQNSCNCNKCNTKKRPSFCTHKSAIA